MVVKVYDLSVRTPVAAHRNRLIPLVPGNLYQIQGLPGMLGFLVWGTPAGVWKKTGLSGMQLFMWGASLMDPDQVIHTKAIYVMMVGKNQIN